jgi:hypothetical protein
MEDRYLKDAYIDVETFGKLSVSFANEYSEKENLNFLIATFNFPNKYSDDKYYLKVKLDKNNLPTLSLTQHINGYNNYYKCLRQYIGESYAKTFATSFCEYIDSEILKMKKKG